MRVVNPEACLVFFLTCVGAQLPTCVNDPYVNAVDAAYCGFMDMNCICGSNVFIVELGKNVPSACEVDEQNDIFSYVDAACSQLGYPNLNLVAKITSLPITAQTSNATATITATILSTVTTTQAGSIASTTSQSSARPTAESTQSNDVSNLSTGAKIGLGIGIPLVVLAIGAALFFGFVQGQKRVRKQAALVAGDPMFNSSVVQKNSLPTEIMTTRKVYGNTSPAELDEAHNRMTSAND